MVWLTWPSPSLLSEWVQACGRLPSTELALVRDAVRERASRVMLAEGTVDRGGAGHEGQRAGPGTTGGRRTHASKAASETRSSDGTEARPKPGLWRRLCQPEACSQRQ